MVAVLPLLPGMRSAAEVLDLYWHPLLGDKWAGLVRDVQLAARREERRGRRKQGQRGTEAGL